MKERNNNSKLRPEDRAKIYAMTSTYLRDSVAGQSDEFAFVRERREKADKLLEDAEYLISIASQDENCQIG